MKQPALFRQSDIDDPYSLYRQYLAQCPLRHDASNNLWIAYSYDHCNTLLHHPEAIIPPISTADTTKLNKEASLLLKYLVRLNNPPHHTGLRHTTRQLLEACRPAPIEPLMERLLPATLGSNIVDWVETVSNRLPALQIASGFHFSPQQQNTLLEYLPALVQIMQPVKTEQQAATINSAAHTMYTIVNQHIGSQEKLSVQLDNDPAGNAEEAVQAAAVNLLGLLIQGYDAGNGLLSHTLLQALSANDRRTLFRDPVKTGAFITETLRFRAPNHHTRRLLQAPVPLNEQLLPKGALVVLVLAAANRDPRQFVHPNNFDPDRPNNNEHLALGTGDHACMARHTIVQLAAEVLTWIFSRYPNLQLADSVIQYEPYQHIRLPKRIRLQLNN